MKEAKLSSKKYGFLPCISYIPPKTRNFYRHVLDYGCADHYLEHAHEFSQIQRKKCLNKWGASLLEPLIDKNNLKWGK